MDEILKDIGDMPPDERAETYKRLASHYRQNGGRLIIGRREDDLYRRAEIMEKHVRSLGGQ